MDDCYIVSRLNNRELSSEVDLVEFLMLLKEKFPFHILIYLILFVRQLLVMLASFCLERFALHFSVP